MAKTAQLSQDESDVNKLECHLALIVHHPERQVLELCIGQ